MPSLEAIAASEAEIVAVVTNPDRPAGRGMKQQPSPVKEAALALDLEVWQPDSVRSEAFERSVRDLDVDVAVVVAYGKILPADLLAAVPKGFVNVHFSLLPAYRGAAPVQRAIIDGRDITGVSIMVLTAGMDEGPVLATAEEPIGPRDTAGELGRRLAGLGAALLVDTLAAYVSGEVQAREQDHAAATYAPKLTPEEVRIDFHALPQVIDRLVRGANPAPGAWATFRGDRLKIHRVGFSDARLAPGELSVGDELLVGTGDTALVLEEVGLAGKKRMSGIEMARGARLEEGEGLV